MTKCEEEIMLEMSRLVKQNFLGVIAALETNSPTVTTFSLSG